MTRDEIINMAREAECSETFGADLFAFTVEELERFANLVAKAAAEEARTAYEREHTRHIVPLPDALRALIEMAVHAEREAIAMFVIANPGAGRYDLATAIRKRGEKQ